MSTPSASTVLKAFEVLGLFVERQVLSASQAAELLNSPRSSTHRMLVTLKEAGILEAADPGRYQLSMRMFELGSSVPLRRDFQDAAMEPLLQLAEMSRLPVHLGVLDGQEVLFVERLSHRGSNLTRPGERGPLHATAAGKVLLAFSDEDRQAAYLAQQLPSYTDFTCTDADRLCSELANIRRTRLATSKQERRVGFVSVAGPVRDSGRRVIASVAVVTTADNGERLRQLQEPLLRTCREIEDRISSLPLPGLRRTGVRRADATVPQYVV